MTGCKILNFLLSLSTIKGRQKPKFPGKVRYSEKTIKEEVSLPFFNICYLIEESVSLRIFLQNSEVWAG